jgi:diguanylate cyclase (GGDEF)-like protein
MQKNRDTAMNRPEPDYYDKLYNTYDETFELGKFLRGYKPVHTETPDVSEEDIQKAFALLNKDTYSKQNFNCGACGSDSCRDMARKISLNLNIPLNCIVHSRDDAAEEHLRNARYINLIRNLGENLMSIEGDEYVPAVLNSLERLCDTFSSGVVSLWKVSPDDDEFDCKRLYHWPPSQHSEEYKIQGKWPLEWVRELSRGKAVSDEISVSEKELFHEAVKSFLIVPVVVKGVFWGFLAFANPAVRRYSSEEISAISASGILIVSAIRERQLEHTAYTDSLTGLYNRRYFTELAKAQYTKSQRIGGPCSALMLDIEHFKKVNDSYGHQCGDEVLKVVSQYLRGALRNYDLLARFGGEEFVVLFSDAANDTAELLAERIRKSIESAVCIFRGQKLSVTVSIGVASINTSSTLEQLIGNADIAMYTAKESGRNRVSVFNS